MISEAHLPIINTLLGTITAAVTFVIIHVKLASNIARHERLLARALASHGCSAERHEVCWSAPARLFKDRAGLRHDFRFTAIDPRGAAHQGWARTGSFIAGALSSQVEIHWDNEEALRGKTPSRHRNTDIHEDAVRL